MMHHTLLIEQVPPGHPDLAQLVSRLDTYLSGLYPPDEIFTVDFSHPSVSEMHFIVAYLEGKPVGCGGLKPLDHTYAELKRFFVEPGHRNAGIAGAMLETLEQTARERGYAGVRLETGEPQVEAVRFYRKHGYAPIDRYGEYADCESSLCMEKRLVGREQLRFIPVDRDDSPYLEGIRDIYNHYVKHTTVSFHTEPLTSEEMRGAVIHSDPRFCSYAVVERGRLAGYVLLSPFKKKQAYDISAEVTIYLHPDFAGRGIGTQALRFIEEQAAADGFLTLIATVCAENAASARLFEGRGYELCALYRGIGRKFGRLLDIRTYQKVLGESLLDAARSCPERD